MVLSALYIGLVWLTAGTVHETSVSELSAAGNRQLKLYVTHLQGQLQKYEFLPELLSTNKRLVELLRRPGNPQRTQALNEYLETINQIASAADTYVMDRDGLTIAASNWQSERPFVGRNFSYRPYFQEAMSGRLGRYFALGTTSGKRGYYFAYPVRDRDEILGAVVIKVNMGDIEEQWSGRPEEVLVTDPDGVIFITTNPDWRFDTLTELSPPVMQRIRASKRYPQTDLQPLRIRWGELLPDGNGQLMQIRNHRTPLAAPPDGRYLLQSLAMIEAGWKVHLLSPLDAVDRRVNNAVLLATIAFAAVLMLALFLRQRHKRRQERARYEQRAQQALREAHAQLEVRVQERTADLIQTNQQLSHEIDERRRTEQALRQAQDELIQAAKLAVLGQMSTGISHELSQPLAAIRSYADNARMLLQQDRSEDVQCNLIQIGELVERMAQIGSQLKLFARKTDGQRVDVLLRESIDAARRLLRPQLRKSETEIVLHLPEDEPRVLADPIRLEQVLVNLIGNAMNAMENSAERRIVIEAVPQGGQLRVTICDTGPGIAPEHLAQIFDPFFTTRKSGLGLGLSISHRIVEGMGGELRAHNAPQGGACFTLELPLAQTTPAGDPQPLVEPQ